MGNYFKIQWKVFNIIDLETCSHLWKYFLTKCFYNDNGFLLFIYL